jgi:hypothetical protein
MEKCNLEEREEQEIDWDVYSSYMKLTPKWRNTWAAVVKYGAGILVPTGQNLLERRGRSDATACPWCNEGAETTGHIYRCTNNEMTKSFTIAKSTKWMISSTMKPQATR